MTPLLTIFTGLFVVLVGLLTARVLQKNPQLTLARTPMPKQLPHRTPAPDPCAMVPLSAYEETLDDWRREHERANKYQHALEAISTLNQDHCAQRIACQALGKSWS